MKTDQEEPPSLQGDLYTNANVLDDLVPDIEQPRQDSSILNPSTSRRSLRGRAHVDATTTDVARFLGETRRNTDGTVAVLAIVFALFCFIWAPVMLRRCRGRRGDRSRDDIDGADMAQFEMEARAMRATLQRMSMMGTLMAEQQQRESLRTGTSNGNFGDGMQLHRREFLDNALLTKKIIFRSEEEEEENNDRADQIEKQQDDTDTTSSSSSSSKERKLPKRQKSNVIVRINSTNCTKQVSQDQKETPQLSPDKSTPKSKDDDNDDNNKDPEEQLPEVEEPEASPPTTISFNGLQEELEPCSICLTEYSDGDEICWSQNDKCNHFFHKECILSWLLNHEECPCCRQNFLCLWGSDEDGGGSAAGRYLHHRSTLMASSSSAAGGSARDTSGLDWASELAEEINQRILQRQRQLHVELERRERELQLQQLELQFSTTSLSPPPSAARSIIGSIPPQRNLTVRNHVISVDDLAAGLLLYRHFPMQFASDPRRLGTFQQHPRALPSSSARSPRNNNDEGDDDDDIHVAHFGMTSPNFGLERWQTYHHEMPSSSGSRSSHLGRPSMLEASPWVLASTSRRAMPTTRLSLNRPTARSAATASSSSTRATAPSQHSTNDPPARTLGGSNGDQQGSDDENVDDDGVITELSA